MIAHRRPRGLGVATLQNFCLTFAVVAEAPRFQHCGNCETAVESFDKCFETIDRRELGGHGAELARQHLFVDPILRARERFGAGPNRNPLRQEFNSWDRNVFEFVSRHPDCFRKRRKPHFVFVGANRMRRGDIEGRAIRVRRIDV